MRATGDVFRKSCPRLLTNPPSYLGGSSCAHELNSPLSEAINTLGFLYSTSERHCHALGCGLCFESDSIALRLRRPMRLGTTLGIKKARKAACMAVTKPPITFFALRRRRCTGIDGRHGKSDYDPSGLRAKLHNQR